MVKVRDDYPVCSKGEVDFTQWVEQLNSQMTQRQDDRSQLLLALELVEQVENECATNNVTWAYGQVSTLEFGMEMVHILSELKADTSTMIAAALYRAVREDKLSIDVVRERWGADVAHLIEGVLRMAVIGALRNDTSSAFGQPEADQIESVRKMLVAMIDDVRVALIKISERTCAIRMAKSNLVEKQLRIAREVRDVYAPLAHRLGIGHLKWELEDLSFRYLEPLRYKEIAKMLAEKRQDRQGYIGHVTSELHKVMSEANITGEVAGRAKHIYSIWKKMQRKGIGFSQVYDIRAVRILVNSTRDCYAVLGLVHALWRNIPHEFDDYIASPKDNGYRSLHTAVVGPKGKVVEVQIRTHQMHEEAEFGVCAHWRYKIEDTEEGSTAYEQKVEWLRKVLSWHEEEGSEGAFAEQLRGGIIQDRIYVFTPDGHVIDLPVGSTALDFAYQVHTEIGHRCKGTRVNGRVVPINHNLRTGDQVEIITGKHEAPSRSWLDESLGYLASSKARANVAHWFRQQATEQNLADGRMLLDREFKRLGLMDLDFLELASRLGYSDLDDLYVAVGASDVGVRDVMAAAQNLYHGPGGHGLVPVQTQLPMTDHNISGLGNLPYQVASCCEPEEPCDIVGYVDARKLVLIHRADCMDALQLAHDEPERIIKLSWGAQKVAYFTANIHLEAWDRIGLLRDVSTILDTESINVTGIITKSNHETSMVRMDIECEIEGIHSLSQLINMLSQLPNVIMVQRRDDTNASD